MFLRQTIDVLHQMTLITKFNSYDFRQHYNILESVKGGLVRETNKLEYKKHSQYFSLKFLKFNM